MEQPEPIGSHCHLAAKALHYWTVALGVALIADSIVRIVFAFTSSKTGRAPTMMNGTEDAWCYAGGLHRCIDSDLIGTSEFFLAAVELIAACLVMAAEVQDGCCVPCVVRYCGMLATFGGRGLFLVAVGSVVALSGQGLYVGPDGLNLAHVIIGACTASTGAVLVCLACPCITMPSNAMHDHYLEVVGLVKAKRSERGVRAAAEAQAPLEEVPTVTGTPLVDHQSGSTLSEVRVEGGDVGTNERCWTAQSSKVENPFYGNQHMVYGTPAASSSIC